MLPPAIAGGLDDVMLHHKMKTYIVQIISPEVRETLAKHFEKVGKPKALLNSVLVTTEQPINAIISIDGVVHVEEEPEIEFTNTQYFPINWALPRISNNPRHYSYNRTGENVDIYILDTGININHREFQGRASTLYSPDNKDCDPNQKTSPSHGTSVASQAAGDSCGVAKKANIHNLRFLGAGSNALKALDVVLDHHKNKRNYNPGVVCMSFTTKSRFFLSMETSMCVANGLICVAASGNSGKNEQLYPASNGYVISVGATDTNNKITDFTTYGNSVDILAPGRLNHTARINGYGYDSGTSFACPLVCGAIALILENSVVKTLNGFRQVKRILLGNAKEKLINTKPQTTDKFLQSITNNPPIYEAKFDSPEYLILFYTAYWNRSPDKNGFEYWLSMVEQNKLSLTQVAENFALSDEAKRRYAYLRSPSGATFSQINTFVRAVYRNLFDLRLSTNDPAITYWSNVLRHGQSTPGAVLAHIIYASVTAKDNNYNTLWSKIISGGRNIPG